ncbi:hypothetical protein PoB_004629200 [Plakobranchus ocellatus]|uniref:DDE Tnp4 domain-containing protein n=1 Tax=Plakobranchus ocellatus TaxID=259542 RepID=A0AAV4BLI6_9GAST|nr:hypothetical protein PoB_004629200 [Plakobranchus ocellatus]
MTPNGLFAHMFGPMEGRRHDAAMFHESGIMTTLEETMNRPDGTPLCLYGDPAYPLRPHVMKPFMGARLTREQEAFNKDMSSAEVEEQQDLLPSRHHTCLSYQRAKELVWDSFLGMT